MANKGEVDILLVEDSAGDAHLFYECLKKCPVRTKLRVAVNGDDALNAIFEQNYQPDIIVLDLDLPKIDGYDVLRRVKSSALNRIPVVVFSSAPTPQGPPHANAYIRKPMTLDSYIETVRRICDEWIVGLSGQGVDRLVPPSE